MPALRDLANILAEAHRAQDSEISEIRLYQDPDEREIRLVEVSRSVGDAGEPMAVRFSPSEEITLPLVLMLLSEAEKDLLDRGDIELPGGWPSNYEPL